jgi:hypothetical protein
MPLAPVDMVEQAANPAPDVTAGEAFPELRLNAARRKTRLGGCYFRDAALDHRGITVLYCYEHIRAALRRFLLK